MKVLVTGGAGFIGSHTCLELLRRGYEVYVIDNFNNGNEEALERVQRLSNRNLLFTKCDVRDFDKVQTVLLEFLPDVVIHFAGLKAVAESVVNPADYYSVNIGGTATLLSAMDKIECRNIIFSSSATVYGEPLYLPCDEMHSLNPLNPYGTTKMIGEKLIKDWSSVNENRRAVALRYFNPVGADSSGMIGENPKGIPNNLMPYIAQVAIGRRKCLQIFGSDYRTKDGTGIRDYIHVVDLAVAHVLAVEKINTLETYEVINIGTGFGISVLEMVSEFERQARKRICYEFAPRRIGDAPEVWADVTKAHAKLGFKAKRGVSEMCRDTWLWQNRNPNGY